jgi:RNA polymerase sigma factor for flagellar operon FliA
MNSGQEEDWLLVDTTAVSPLEALGGRELNEALRSLISELPADERNLIQSTYFEGLSLQKAADRMGISKSWASRLHANTLKRLAKSVFRLGFAR